MRFRWGLVLCVLLLLCGGCAPWRAPEQTVTQPSAAVIVIPGYKGSALYTESGDQVWLTSSQIVFGSKSLALPNPEIGLVNDPLQAKGILYRTPIIPFLYRYDIYDSLVQRLRTELGSAVLVHEFAYDWRRDNIETLQQLDSLIHRFRSSGIEKIMLVGHSMGGFITSYYLRYGAQDPDTARENWAGGQLVSAAVCVGVPYRGSLDIFLDMHKGAYTGPNDALLSKVSLSSFPSSYQLIPSPQEEVVFPKVDLHDVSQWEKQRWGLFATEYAETSPQGVRSFTDRQLRRARAISTLLLSNAKHTEAPNIRLLNIVGQGRETSERAQVSQPLELPHVEMGDGDGLVTVSSALLPDRLAQALSSTEIRTGARHGGMLADADIQQVVVDFFRGMAPRG